MNTIIEDLNWRYATKKFNTERKVDASDLEIIKKSLQLVPTSFGLQALKYLIIEDAATREKLLPLAYNQQQIVDASHLIVICSYKSGFNELVDSYVENTAKTRELEIESLTGFGGFMKSSFEKMTDEQISNWSSKQAYIALGQVLNTLATLKIDATPMEGFSAVEFDKALNLDSQNLTSTVIIPIGYRHAEDQNQHLKKVRRTEEELFAII